MHDIHKQEYLDNSQNWITVTGEILIEKYQIAVYDMVHKIQFWFLAPVLNGISPSVHWEEWFC